MPRYFFHTFNGHPFPDMDGTELPGLGRPDARQSGPPVRSSVTAARNPGTARIGIWRCSDGVGQPMLWLRFSVEELSDAESAV